jgi:hypothetical protein
MNPAFLRASAPASVSPRVFPFAVRGFPLRPAVSRSLPSSPSPVPVVGRVLPSRPLATAAEVYALYRRKIALAPLVEPVEDEA